MTAKANSILLEKKKKPYCAVGKLGNKLLSTTTKHSESLKQKKFNGCTCSSRKRKILTVFYSPLEEFAQLLRPTQELKQK